MKWKHCARTENCAALSWTPEGDDHYVISHRSRQHTVSWRPTGRHVHVGTWTTKAAATRAAEAHASQGKDRFSALAAAPDQHIQAQLDMRRGNRR